MKSMPLPMMQSALPLPLLHRGKVREVYEVDADRLLIVASDRVSAFDVIMDQPIPRKGELLTQITAWWLDQLGASIAHHLISVNTTEIRSEIPGLADCPELWAQRSMLVRRTEPVPVECVIRGYLAGSAFKEYRESQTLAGEPMPPGLDNSSRLPQPLFSPATKAQEGQHDENIPENEVARLLGSEQAQRLKDLSMEIYGFGSALAETRGIILADTKFEFGIARGGDLLLIDEVLTPDSSRFWPRDTYEVGRSRPSLDKQPVRDFLETLPAWNKQPPPPTLPEEVVSATTQRYLEIFRRLTGVDLDAYSPPIFDDPA